MIGFINKLLKQNLEPLKSEQMQAFSVEADYEKDFPNYYKEHLESYFKEYFSQKFINLKRYNKLLYNALNIAIISFIITLIVIFTPLRNYYNIIAHGFDHAMASYTTWWYGLPKWMQIIFPSKLVIWSFPHPLTLELLILFFITLYLFIFLLRTRISIKEKILLPIYEYMGDFFYSTQNSIQNEVFYNALILPSHDQISFSNGSIIGNYPDARIEIVETSLLIQDPDSKFKPSTPTFIGLLIVVNFPKGISIKGHHLFTSNVPNWLTQLLAKEQKLSKYGYSGTSELYSSDIEEIKKIDPNGLLNTIDEIAKIVANNNRSKKAFYLDDKIVSFLKRKKPISLLENIDKLIQCAIYEQKLFIMIPSNKELLLTQSIFDHNSNKYNQDIHIILATLYLTFLFIKHINAEQNYE